jgi:N4-gp56 family major capsid protein
MPDYTLVTSVAGSPGTLNSANYAIPGGYPLSANSIGTGTGVMAAGQQHMDAGVWEQGLILNARERLFYANPAWIRQGSIPKGHKPRTVMVKVNEISNLQISTQTLIDNNYRLVEGVTPDTDLRMTVDTIEITPQQYGVVMYYSDVVEAVTVFQFKTVVMERLGWALGKIIDALVKLHYLANLPSADSTLTGKEGTGNLSWLRLLRLRAKLDAANIDPPQSEGEWFPLIIHPNQIPDLLRDANVKASIDNSNVGWDPAKNPFVHNTRIGEAAGFRFYRTSGCATYDDVTPGGAIDGYINITVGRDLIASTALQAPEIGTHPNLGAAFNNTPGLVNNASSPVSIIEKGLGSGGSFDPLNQQASIGAKWSFGLKLTQPTHGFQVKMTSDYVG